MRSLNHILSGATKCKFLKLSAEFFLDKEVRKVIQSKQKVIIYNILKYCICITSKNNSINEFYSLENLIIRKASLSKSFLT